MTPTKSYDLHNQWYNKHFPTNSSKTALYEKNRSAGKNNIAHWLQQIFFNCLDPLLKEQAQNWLTVGDAYGFDAQYIAASGNRSLATDLNTDLLAVALQQGVVEACAAENAEKLSFEDNHFDYVLCKESYHHFPRPYAAMYEMIRVARKGVVVIEPQDPVVRMPLLLLLRNLLASRDALLNNIWKNRFSFEPVGNFVYKISEREVEKLAAGLNLPLVAFKRINPNFWFAGADQVPADHSSKRFLAIQLKKRFLDLLVRLKLVPAQVLAVVIFKDMPEQKTIRALQQIDYHLVRIPVNPYVAP